jgi:transcriptional regulator with XRE-family HTH domain
VGTLSDVTMTFPRLLKVLRVDAGLSLADLAARVHYSRGHIHNVEAGKRAAAADFAGAADRALGAGGLLVHQWGVEEAARLSQARITQLLAASAAGSRDLADMPGLDVDDLGADVEDLAVAYLAAPPAPMLGDAHTVRQEVVERLRTHHHRPAERVELYRAAGHLSGILAYAALDLGHPDIALEHARAAWRCADFAGDDELRVWVRGTQSLIARFQSDYPRALEYVLDGLRYAGAPDAVDRAAAGRGGGAGALGGGISAGRQAARAGIGGTGLARLLCGQAQCLANLGDSRGANAALNAAEDAREHITGTDSMGGLFGFSVAKQRYYAGSSLIWLDGGPDAVRAAGEAEAAIGLWEQQPAQERSLDDEHLAHIYLATARVQLGEVEGALAAVRPILDLPPEMRISWIVKRLGRLAELLEEPRFAHSALARDAAETIRAAAG